MRFTAAGAGSGSNPIGHTLGKDTAPETTGRGTRRAHEHEDYHIHESRGGPRDAIMQANVVQHDVPPGEDGLHLVPEYNRKIASGKAIRILMKMESTGSCELETGSVYGAAIALPQIARSADWSGSMTALALRAFFFLAVNVSLQTFILVMIGTEQLIMYPFAGQMHLCDFGASIPKCDADPNYPTCKGPGGTTLSFPRLYSYDIWSTRLYLRDALNQLFPDRKGDIHSAIDPGEYGVEDYWCRAACIFIFMMAVVDDLRATLNLARLLWIVPTQAESWISYEPPEWANKEDAKAVHGWSELDLVRFYVAGIPRAWKVLNFIVIWIPKFFLWLALAATGVHYLMETADIVDMVVNAMALTFVLDIDEMVFARLTTGVTQQIMAKLEDMPLYDLSCEEEESDYDVMERFNREEQGCARWKKFSLILPKRLFTIICLQVFFMWLYYARNCKYDQNGGLVSKDVHYPHYLGLNPLGLMFGIEPSGEEEPYWTMPGE